MSRQANMLYLYYRTCFKSLIHRILKNNSTNVINFLKDKKIYENTKNIGQSNKKSYLIAHRAACLDAPENSIEALHLAVKNGAKCIEFDVQMTLDGHAIVFHDRKVDRLTDSSGRVSNMTLEEIRSLDIVAKHKFKERFSPCRIPLLKEFVDECLKLNLLMIMDLKTYENSEKTAAIISNLYKATPELYNSALVSSFYPNLLYDIRMKDQNISCSMAWEPHYFAYKNHYYSGGSLTHMTRRFMSPLSHKKALISDFITDWLYHNYLWYTLGLSAVVVHKDVISHTYVENWKKKDMPILAYTINSLPTQIHFANEFNVNCITDTMLL